MRIGCAHAALTRLALYVILKVRHFAFCFLTNPLPFFAFDGTGVMVTRQAGEALYVASEPMSIKLMRSQRIPEGVLLAFP